SAFFDRITNRHDHAYLITGDVPEAESHADAEGRVAHLLEEIARDFKARRPGTKSALPKPITKVWRWHH
ncbi:MAG TPA: hypothetical protein VLK30_12335, partial [Candidatus Limnocylindrales bacterium]|nr:hypothetical protein [Candidatus Limnocylindrales bacterium]